MSETTNGKIQNLLERAARQSDSPTSEGSSVAKATRIFPDAANAEEAFVFLRKSLFSIEQWNVSSEISSFELIDKIGRAAPTKSAAVGDYIKIILPGSGKDDWVKVIEITETPDEIVLTVQPSHDPTDAENKNTTSHFFTDASTNNFCLQQKDAKINFYVIGLNEQTNTEATSGILETARNLATANVGSFSGIQKTQWETFCRNFLGTGNER